MTPERSARKRRVRHHVNPLKEDYLYTGAGPLLLPEGPVEVELGCADARFLFERALHERERPATTYLGLEIRREMVDRVNRRAAALGLSNLRALFANISIDLPRLFPPSRLDRIYINFPDPWFKRAHSKRRLLTPELARTLSGLLAPQGEIFFQSDVFDLALDAMAALEGVGSIENACGEWSFCRDNPYRAVSLREARVLEKGHRVWRMRYLRSERATLFDRMR